MRSSRALRAATGFSAFTSTALQTRTKQRNRSAPIHSTTWAYRSAKTEDRQALPSGRTASGSGTKTLSHSRSRRNQKPTEPERSCYLTGTPHTTGLLETVTTTSPIGSYNGPCSSPNPNSVPTNADRYRRSEEHTSELQSPCNL